MGNLVERQARKELSKLLLDLKPGSGVALPDHTAQSEQVISIVKEEGMGTIAPNDTRCRAATAKGNRCKDEIFFDEPMATFSQFCEDHHKQTEQSRSNKAKKVKKFVASKATVEAKA